MGCVRCPIPGPVAVIVGLSITQQLSEVGVLERQLFLASCRDDYMSRSALQRNTRVSCMCRATEQSKRHAI
jgi:hypothetical protein